MTAPTISYSLPCYYLLGFISPPFCCFITHCHAYTAPSFILPAALFSNFCSWFCESVGLVSHWVILFALFGDQMRSQNPILGLFWRKPQCPVAGGTSLCCFPSTTFHSHPKSALRGFCHFRCKCSPQERLCVRGSLSTASYGCENPSHHDRAILSL